MLRKTSVAAANAALVSFGMATLSILGAGFYQLCILFSVKPGVGLSGLEDRRELSLLATAFFAAVAVGLLVIASLASTFTPRGRTIPNSSKPSKEDLSERVHQDVARERIYSALGLNPNGTLD